MKVVVGGELPNLVAALELHRKSPAARVPAKLDLIIY